jgi:hypothetical protein
MDLIFPKLTELFIAVSGEGLEINRNRSGDAYRAASAAFQRDHTRSSLEALRAAAANYDALLSINPATEFTALQNAHAELTKALLAPKPNFEALWGLLQNLDREATKVAAIEKQFQTASGGGAVQKPE